jgi:hypothetical protein
MFAAQEDKVAENNFEQTAADINLAALIPLLWEIGNLKRLRAANFENSFAANLFFRAWREIASGAPLKCVAFKTSAEAIAASQLGAIDASVLSQSDLTNSEIQTILERSFDLSAKQI